MNKTNRNRMSGWGDYVTSTISVTLVLFILGLVGVINISFDGINRQVKEKMGFTVVLADSVSAVAVDSMMEVCAAAPYVSEFKYLSADDVMAEETQDGGAELVELLGVNPYAAMIEVRLKADYANVDSIAFIADRWRAMAVVDEVSVNTEMIDNLNRNAGLINMVLALMAAALMLISFVLINNTVRLTVFARRFLIHTMKLVGAKGSFIRKPFLVVNTVQGVVAGIMASGMLAGLTAWAHSFDVNISALLPWSSMALVYGCLVVLGILICVCAAMFATNRYLRKNYDEMFD